MVLLVIAQRIVVNSLREIALVITGWTHNFALHNRWVHFYLFLAAQADELKSEQAGSAFFDYVNGGSPPPRRYLWLFFK